MEMQYLFHSGFALKSDSFTMIIDYYKDACNGPKLAELINRPGKLYILATHSHPDHYNPIILSLKKTRPDIIYVFSKDIESEDTKDMACFLEKGQLYEDDTIKIKAYGSTDLGISFAIEDKNTGALIFHGGDLNNWHWNEEVSAEEAKAFEDDFLQELECIAKDYKRFDLVMFPVDSRLGKDYTMGAKQFLEKIPGAYFAPMHFWEQYEKAAAFEKDAEALGSKFIKWTHQGESVSVQM